MSKPLKDIARPLVFGFVAWWCERVGRTADTQTNVKWIVDHWDGCNVPLGYVVEVEIKLRYTGNGVTPPTRRVGDTKPLGVADD